MGDDDGGPEMIALAIGGSAVAWAVAHIAPVLGVVSGAILPTDVGDTLGVVVQVANVGAAGLLAWAIRLIAPGVKSAIEGHIQFMKSLSDQLTESAHRDKAATERLERIDTKIDELHTGCVVAQRYEQPKRPTKPMRTNEGTHNA